LVITKAVIRSRLIMPNFRMADSRKTTILNGHAA